MGSDRSQHREMQEVVVLVLLVVSATAKFCPHERNGDKCKSKLGEYKCGIFLYNLQGREQYYWSEVLPDDLGKPNNIYLDMANFNNSVDCGPTAPTTYNGRCYGLLSTVLEYPLDSCKGSKRIGDYICGNVKRRLRNNGEFKKDGKDQIELRGQYSYCGNDWTNVDYYGVPLSHQKICCTNAGKLRSCDGTPFKS